MAEIIELDNRMMGENLRKARTARGMTQTELAKRLEDGTLVSPPLEDLAPFLPREELRNIMLIPLMDEE